MVLTRAARPGMNRARCAASCARCQRPAAAVSSALLRRPDMRRGCRMIAWCDPIPERAGDARRHLQGPPTGPINSPKARAVQASSGRPKVNRRVQRLSVFKMSAAGRFRLATDLRKKKMPFIVLEGKFAHRLRDGRAVDDQLRARWTSCPRASSQKPDSPRREVKIDDDRSRVAVARTREQVRRPHRPPTNVWIYVGEKVISEC